MTETTDHAERRTRYATALARIRGTCASAENAVMAVADAEQAELHTRIRELESMCRDTDRLRQDWVEMRDRVEELDERAKALAAAVPAPQPAAPVSDDLLAAQLAPLEAQARDGWEQQRAQHRAKDWRKAAEICDEAGAVYASKELNDQAYAAYQLMERFLRLADEAEYVAAPCSAGGCEPGGEPCTTHERLMAHAEGDHELCGPDCAPASGPGRVAGETQQPDTRKACTCSHPADEHSIYGCADDCGCEWMPKRRAPMDPVHILGIYADELPAAVSQPETEA